MPGSDDELLGTIRDAVRRSRVGLRFKTDFGALLYEVVNSGPAEPAGSTIVLLMLSPLLVLVAGVIGLVALLFVAHQVSVLQPLVQALIADGQIIGALAAIILVPFYRIWRRWVALSYLLIWERLWHAAALSLSMKDDSLVCESPRGDWRAFAKALQSA